MRLENRGRGRPAANPGHRVERGSQMALWLILIIAGVVMIVLGVAVEAAKVLLWIGIILLVVSLIGWLVGRGRRAV
ncbi:hypothetical protein CTKZ_07130 [Cellulomonas algicola]|uniref:DUF4175 domain-containing protein n=2 Tax=Cellulomonas TaxID=1707 RepID=A0A401UWW8_9CELL|nr:hypothetical protein CTKZ_07130 [Cellulomonas algicola]